MTQQHMNDMFLRPPQHSGPPVAPWAPAPSAVGTLLISVGRPNCGWIRRMLWEQQRMGQIDSFEESPGWLWRSFAIVGRKSSLEAIYARLRQVLPEED